VSSTIRTPWTGVVKAASQFGRFGVVGIVALVVDVGLFNVLRFAGGEGPLFQWVLGAKVISSAVATIVSWLGNRYWTFRDTRRQQVRHEFVLFVIMCTIGLMISLACLALSHYVFGLTSPLDDNISANVIGLAMGTAFRFYAYRKWVFTAPDITESVLDVQGAQMQSDKAA
jgi:putative flippase GtrA